MATILLGSRRSDGSAQRGTSPPELWRRALVCQHDKPQAATIAGLTMRLSGLLLACFVVFHVLHLTTGSIRPATFDAHNIYGNVVGGFRVGWVAAFYLVALAALGLHIYHGWWASFRTLGVGSRSPTPQRRPFGIVLALILWIGFSSIPIAALAGVLKLP